MYDETLDAKAGPVIMAFFQHGGSNIHYEVTGQGPPLLFLPGVTDSISAHSDWLARIARDHRVIAADLPGSGRSGPQPRHYHVNYYEDDARSFAALLQELGAANTHLVGYSDGGEVALMMAISTPEVARSVLTWGAVGFIDDPGGKAATFFRTLFDLPSPETQDWRDILVARYGAELARDITRNFADGLGAFVAAGGDISRSRAHQIKCPVCLITGKQDIFNPEALLMKLAEQIATVETHVVEGAGHGVHEDRPDWFAATLTDWLARH